MLQQKTKYITRRRRHLSQLRQRCVHYLICFIMSDDLLFSALQNYAKQTVYRCTGVTVHILTKLANQQTVAAKRKVVRGM